MVFEDDETLRMYVDESLEHLSDIENDLLTIEEGGPTLMKTLSTMCSEQPIPSKAGPVLWGLRWLKSFPIIWKTSWVWSELWI